MQRGKDFGFPKKVLKESEFFVMWVRVGLLTSTFIEFLYLRLRVAVCNVLPSKEKPSVLSKDVPHLSPEQIRRRQPVQNSGV